MEAEATVSGGMEKVKQRWGRGGFCQWASFQRTVVGGKIIIFLLNRDRIGFSFFFFLLDYFLLGLYRLGLSWV